MSQKCYKIIFICTSSNAYHDFFTCHLHYVLRASCFTHGTLCTVQTIIVHSIVIIRELVKFVPKIAQIISLIRNPLHWWYMPANSSQEMLSVLCFSCIKDFVLENVNIINPNNQIQIFTILITNNGYITLNITKGYT